MAGLSFPFMAALGFVLVPTAASATIVSFFDGISAGRAQFDDIVHRAGGSVSNDIWAEPGGVSPVWERPAYTVATNDGSDLYFDLYGIGLDTFHQTLSGYGVLVTVGDGTSGATSHLGEYFGDGITFTFATPINAFGIEVGDWGTCCWLPTTDILVSFDGRVPVIVASVDHDTQSKSQQPSQFDPNPDLNSHSVFVAAFDDSAAFSKVSIWGSANGEALVFGGDVRWSTLPTGSLTPGLAQTPLPAGGLLLGTALIGMGAALRKRRPQV